MLSGAIDPECRQRQRTILTGNVGAVVGADATILSPVTIQTAADDAPDQQATNLLGHATIHLVVTGTATAGRELFVTAAQTTVGRTAPPTGPTRARCIRGVA